MYQYIGNDVTAQFILYGKNYKYEETSDRGEFTYWGQYEIEDTLLLMEIYDRSRLPYGYMNGSIQVLGESAGSTAQWQVINADRNKPIPFAAIVLYDHEMKMLEIFECDKKGIAQVIDWPNAKYAEIDYVGFLPVIIEYQQYRSKNLLIEMKNYIPAGPWKGDCLITQEGAILNYIIDNPKNATSITNNGLVFLRK